MVGLCFAFLLAIDIGCIKKYDAVTIHHELFLVTACDRCEFDLHYVIRLGLLSRIKSATHNQEEDVHRIHTTAAGNK